MSKPAFTALAKRTNEAARATGAEIAATLDVSDLSTGEILNAIASGFLAHAVEVHIRSKLSLNMDTKRARKELQAEVDNYFRQLSSSAHLAVAMAKGVH